MPYNICVRAVPAPMNINANKVEAVSLSRKVSYLPTYLHGALHVLFLRARTMSGTARSTESTDFVTTSRHPRSKR
eukprot:2022603-Pleurochrysis_carterae.AAC.1